MRPHAVILGLALLASPTLAEEAPTDEDPGPQTAWLAAAAATLENEFVARFGEQQRDRARQGVAQVGSFWREAEDGDRQVFLDFVRRNFAGDAATLDTTFERFERLLEKLDGHMLEIVLAMREQTDLGAEFERMARLGNVAPDLWMKQATGSAVGPESLLAATERALAELGGSQGGPPVRDTNAGRLSPGGTGCHAT